jgi:hypothetical protein
MASTPEALVKKRIGKTTALQDAHIERIQKAGGTAVIINEQNIDTLPALLESMR